MIPRRASAKEESQYVKFYRFYGCKLQEMGQQLQGDCPFSDCGREGHFFASPGTGLWDCKICSRSGNTYTFANEFLQDCRSITTDADLEQLAELRIGIKIPTLDLFGVALNPHNGDWLIPGYSLESKLTNLWAWKECFDQKDQTWNRKIMAGPTFKQTLFGLQFFRNKSTLPIWICEGHWDTMAWYDVLSTVKNAETGHRLIDEHDILGCPGVGVFPKELVGLLNGRDVRVLFDNDEAGKKGIDHIVKTIAQHGSIPRKFSTCRWPAGTKSGFDVRDQVIASFN